MKYNFNKFYKYFFVQRLNIFVVIIISSL